MTELSQTLSQRNYSDVSTLVHKLQTPLQGMGSAFIASLVGLLFSTALTLFNFKFNTVLAKFQLVSSLEDYLDNVYQPTVEGHSRLDKAVEKMVLQFSHFLDRFGETVRGAVEDALKENIQKIEDANIKASNLATEVYSRFLDASGTLERGAVIFGESAEVIERTQFPDKLSTLTEGLANTQREFSQSSLILNDSMKFTESATKLLHNSVVEVAHLSEQTAQVLEITQSSQQSLSEIIPQLHQGAQMFQLAVKTLDESQNRIEIRADNLGDIQVELANLVETIKNHTEQVILEIKALCNQFQTKPEKTEERLLPHLPQPTLPLEAQIKFEEALSDYRNRNYKKAATGINELIITYPRMPQFCLLRGDIHFQLKNYDVARTAYQTVLKISRDLELRKNAQIGLNNITSYEHR